ncbi:MAG: GNAT family N-acetyltransferase [Clostridia bacterium]|nr:GNAT family N-acetyltransferase [Clostridia bacterium]
MSNSKKTQIRYVEYADKDFWFSLDGHLPISEFDKKVRDKSGYVLSVENKPVGILRYNLFWDNTPFCNLIYLKEGYQRKGYGKILMDFWETDMKKAGYNLILVSTRSDESAQHFYRALGYKNCGVLTAPDQPEELFLGKYI